GNHVFIPPAVAGNPQIVGHELSHLSANLNGKPETGHVNSAGIPVTDPNQGSEREADTDGAAFAAGEKTAPSVIAQRAVTGGRAGSGGAPAMPTLQRMAGSHVVARVKDTKGKAKATGEAEESSEPKSQTAWKRRFEEIDARARQCTCRQQDPHAGRVTPNAMIRLPRSYKKQPDEQSLRHISRVLYNALGHLVTPETETTRTTEGEASASADEKEQEVESMLINGHLVFATNLNQTAVDLHAALQAADPETDSDDADAQALRDIMLTDFDSLGHEADEEQEPVTTDSGKRQAPAGGPQAGKRRKTDKGAAPGPAPTSARNYDRKQRDRQARLKVAEGFKTQAMPSVPLDSAMDVDGPAPDARAASHKRDNRTLQGLRKMKYIRKIDVSNARAKDPKYREYLADLLKPTGQYEEYAYILVNGDMKKSVHAEQKLLMLLNSAEVNSETPLDGPVLIRGRKRPCQACLGLLEFVRKDLKIDLRYNPNGNHHFTGAVESAVKYNYRDAGEKSEEFYDDLGERMGNMQISHVSAPRKASALEGEGVGEVESDDEGDRQQRLTLKEVRDKETGKLKYLKYPNVGEQYMSDTASTSDASGDSDSVPELTTRTGRVSIGGQSGRRTNTSGQGPGAPAPATQNVRHQHDSEDFKKNIEPLLLKEMDEDLKKKREKRVKLKGEGKRPAKEDSYQFSDSLIHRISELTNKENQQATKKAIASWFGIESSALPKLLDQPNKEPKQARQADGKTKDEIVGQMKTLDPAFYSEWKRLKDGEVMAKIPEFEKGFRRLLGEIMYGRPGNNISPASLAKKVLRVNEYTFKNSRAPKIRDEFYPGQKDKDKAKAGAGRAPR
ncbi:hypothetical protein ACWGI8_26690, partial [Streptomyces sp. NPDC054841]